MMTENLHDNRKQLENSLANLKIEPNNNQPENLQELLPDVKQSKEDKIRMETEAISQTATSDNQEHKITQFVLQLLGDLKGQEELHLGEVKELRKELEEKDNMCNQLKLEISQVRENPTFYDLKSHEERHSREVKDLRTQLELNDNVNQKLTNEVFTVRKNFIQMREQLLNDQKSQEGRHLQEVKELRLELESKDNNLKDAEEHHLREVTELRKELKINVNMFKQLTNEVFEMQQSLENQEQRHLLEINEKHKELESKDSLCQLLELKVSQVRENPEFLQMRQQLLDELESQKELHLVEVSKLCKELNTLDSIIYQLESDVIAEQEIAVDKYRLCFEKEQEAAQLRDRLNFNMSCPICMEPWNSSAHRMVALLCGHIFGESCARQCLERNLHCPECRGPASENDIRKLFPR